ncbi:c-type cytochrome [Formosa algae]|uniref:Cytochrome c n=1 Tax=Formosa algae TaxID=225843 RepID=A0A9X0YJG9_9FLAO|nr:c-type cytochrome [Formosa algae]MBP1839724.1 cytochrome c [Formosa algae]MDQ0335323.1 cytochrome c [Formosa algae]OEI79280.1 hypothetical protein AST99_15795 [Formosa algae]
MKSKRMLSRITGLIAMVLLTSCINGLKRKPKTEFIYPDLHIERHQKPKSKGVGHVRFVDLADTISNVLADKGKLIFEAQCAACHKLTDQRLVGPGWAGITNYRRPEWIMNMILNTDEMLEKDEAAIIQLKDCMTRMPNQYLTKTEARSVLEFMRRNDMQQVKSKDGAAAK